MPIRLGEGDGMALSPDGRYALVLQYTDPQRLALYEYEAAAPQLIPSTGLVYQPIGQWFPDSRRILFEGSEPRRPGRIWMQELPGGKPQAVTPEGVELEGAGLSPDGTMLAARSPDGCLRLFPIIGGTPVDIPGVQAGDRLVGWRGQRLVLAAPSDRMVRLDEVDIATGTRTRGKEIARPYSATVAQFTQVLVAADGETIVFGINQRVSTLHIAEGLQ